MTGQQIQACPADQPHRLSQYQGRPLRVLQIHNFYQQRGGEDVVVENEAWLLREAGVELQTWYLDSAACSGQISGFSKLSLGLKLFWNRQAQRELEAKLQANPVDIIHLHNSFPLFSPSIIHRAKQLGIPVVSTVHNFRWWHPTGCIEEAAQLQQSSWQLFGQRLYRQSRLATALMVLYGQLHLWLQSLQRCQRLICPSQFVADALVQAGISPQQLLVKPHSVAPAVSADDASWQHISRGTANALSECLPAATAQVPQQEYCAAAAAPGYVLFVGRADESKGLLFLLEAWQTMTCPLWIVGVSAEQARQFPGYQENPWVQFAGVQTPAALREFYQHAALLVVPSLVAETFGNVVIEAFSHGVPCVVSHRGALPELVRAGHNSQFNTAHIDAATALGHQVTAGVVFVAGDQTDFRQKVSACLQQPEQLQQMANQARALYVANYLPQHNQQALLACYQQVLAE